MALVNRNNYDGWEDQIRNMIPLSDSIQLYDDHTDINIHFSYKGYEVSTNLNTPYSYKTKANPLGLIDQLISDKEKESIHEDFFRELVIHISVDDLLDEDDEGEEDDDLDEEYDEEEEDILRTYFPNMYLPNNLQTNFNKAANKVYVLIGMMETPEFDIYQFVSEWNLMIHNDRITFYAPYLSKSVYEWMGWAIKIIDNILAFFKEEEEDDEDDYDEEIEEVE